MHYNHSVFLKMIPQVIIHVGQKNIIINFKKGHTCNYTISECAQTVQHLKPFIKIYITISTFWKLPYFRLVSGL